MSIKATLSAWWSAWSYVVILALLLALSMWVNLQQYVRSKTAPLRAANKDLTDTVNTIRDIGKAAQRDGDKLLADLDEIARRGQRTRIEYRDAAAARPLAAQCAPGQARMDAVNKGVPLTPTPEAKR